MEMLQKDQSAAEGAGKAEESPVPLRRHSTHSPYTRLGSGGGGGVSSLTVRLQPSPPAAAQRGSLSQSGSLPPTPAQRPVARQRRSLPDGGLGSGAPSTPQTPARKPSEEFSKIPEQQPENGDSLSQEVSSLTEPSPPKKKTETSPVSETTEPAQVIPPKPAARHAAPEKTPSPPDLLTWPWTAEDEAAEAKLAEQADQDLWEDTRAQSSPDKTKASSRSDNSSPSAYDTAGECSFSPRASIGDPRPAEGTAVHGAARARVISEGQEASSGTEIDAPDDDVFTDVTGIPAAVTATVTSL